MPLNKRKPARTRIVRDKKRKALAKSILE